MILLILHRSFGSSATIIVAAMILRPAASSDRQSLDARVNLKDALLSAGCQWLPGWAGVRRAERCTCNNGAQASATSF